MLDLPTLLIVLAGYVGLLLAVAIITERVPRFRRAASHSPVVYGLSIAIYCTAWTFYGSVGSAANAGILFLTIYIGPTLAIIAGGPILRRLIRWKETHRITSVADAIAIRFGSSRSIAAAVTLFVLVGTVPYVALQLKALVTSIDLVTADASATDLDTASGSGFSATLGFGVAIATAIFTILFGVRRLDPTERHPGMMATLAAESIIKLVAFLAVGIFATWGLHDGVGDLVGKVEAMRQTTGDQAPALPSATTWMTYMLLAAWAFLFLPRQFHTIVVENSSVRHLRTAQWLLPLYLLTINLFVLPIAWAGLAMGHAASDADSFVLLLPITNDAPWLALLVFIGGVSAATGMIMVCSMTLSTMVTNHLVVPVADRVVGLGRIGRHLLPIRWAAVLALSLAGYGFALFIGDSYMLVRIGMISFAAVLQFAPAMLAALFWRGASRTGVLAGLTAGFTLWVWTLIVPAAVRSGWLPESILELGPFGLELLRPEALLGLTSLESMPHAVVWTLAANAASLVIGSALAPADAETRRRCESFLGESEAAPTPLAALPVEIPLADRCARMEAVAVRYLPTGDAAALVRQCVRHTGLEQREEVDLAELDALCLEFGRRIAGTIGASSAARALAGAKLMSQDEVERLSRARGTLDLVGEMDAVELRSRIREARRHQASIEAEAERLELEVARRTEELVGARDALLESNDALRQSQELAESANEAKSLFLAQISHELRTPMTAIIGFAELLADPTHDPQDRATWVDTIHRNGQHLLDVINDLLDVSRLEQGRLEIELMSCDPWSITSDVVELLAVPAATKGLTLRIVADSPLPDRVTTDPSRLRQILVNLIGNAIKFTETGGVEIGLSWTEGVVAVRVDDTGIGIDPEQIARLFEPFEQADASHSRRFGGTGLGLAISRHLSRLLGGNLTADHASGGGARFAFTIEAPPASETPHRTPESILAGAGARASGDDPPRTQASEAPRSGQAPPPEEPSAGPQVLVVEDGPDNRRLLTALLRRRGCVVHTANDGREGVDAVKAAAAEGQHFDLILMDMQMPVMDGVEATRTLRAAGFRTPIVAVTANAMDADRQRCLDAGCDDFITKPIDRTKLGAVIQRYASGPAGVPASILPRDARSDIAESDAAA